MSNYNNLPIGLLIVRRSKSAPKYVDKRLEQAAEQFGSFHTRNSQDLRSLMILTVDHNNYLSGMRDLLGFLRSKAERADDPGVAGTPAPIPNQSLAPVRVEERNGRVSLISDRDSALGASEVDFNGWREPVLDHLQELLSGDFRTGTNHSRARDRLIALATLFEGTVVTVKERQFRIGYEIERFDGLVSAYRSGADDMPALNAAVLEDLDRLRIALVMGIGKLDRWSEFRRAATNDPMREGDANPFVVSSAVNEMVAGMENLPTYFDPLLPQTFRFLSEATRDPLGATKTVVYGAVKSAENVIAFLGQRALGIGTKVVDAVEHHISKAVAATLIAGLSGVALQISGALPMGWIWLRPLLDALAKIGSG